MKKGWSIAVLLLLIAALLLPLTTGAVTTEELETATAYPPKTYFYSQLSDNAKLIYNALADEESLTALKTGEPVVIKSYTATFANGIDQNKYNEIYSTFSDQVDDMSVVMQSVTDAMAAFYQDRCEIFWTTGVRSRISYLKNGEPISGSLTLDIGNSYTAQLEVVLPLAADWDGEGDSDRVLEDDIATLQANIDAVVTEAKKKTSRFAQIEYINAQLCTYNSYNTIAAEGDYDLRYPWTPLSALDQLTWPDDIAIGSLKPVCEGYAKALKMICDEMDIPCVLVSGIGDGGEHMWSYVQMEDGKWYAMDVTWNDSTGHDGYLLVGKDVMDEKHTTHSRFMQGEHMTFFYPVLQDMAYVAPATGLIVTVQDDAYEALSEGYTDPVAIPIHIQNVGSDAEEITAVAVDGDAFVIAGPDGLVLTGGATDTESYTISPKTGLAAGNYSATVTVTYGTGEYAVAPVFVTIEAMEPPPPGPGDDGNGTESGGQEGDPVLPETEGGNGVIPEPEGIWEQLPFEIDGGQIRLLVIVGLSAAVLLGLLLLALLVRAVIGIFRK